MTEAGSRDTVGGPPVDPRNSVIHSIGVDLIEIERIRHAMERQGERFLRRLFTRAEIAYCETKLMRHINYAGRWAAKEAVLKAFGMGMRGPYSWLEVEISNNEMGRPEVRLGHRAAEEFRRIRGTAVHVSISHCHEHAAAIAVIEKEDGA